MIAPNTSVVNGLATMDFWLICCNAQKVLHSLKEAVMVRIPKMSWTASRALIKDQCGQTGLHGPLVQVHVVIKQLKNDQDYAFLNLAMVMTLRLVLVLICPCVLLLGPLSLHVLKLVDMLPDTVQDKMKLKLILVRIYQKCLGNLQVLVLISHAG